MAKNTEFESMQDLLEEKKKIEKKMGKVMIPCSHTKDNGKLKVDFLSGSTVRCKRCNAVFDFDSIPNKELKEAIRTVHNAINQIKALSSDPEKEHGVIKQLGMLDYNLTGLEELYSRTQDTWGKNKKKKKRGYDNDFGAFGANNIEFIGGKKGYRY